MDKIERAREMFRVLEGCEGPAVEVARRAFYIQSELASS